MSDSIADIETRLKRVLTECTTVPNVQEEIGSDSSLVGDDAVLDSVALLKFVLGIETEFSILLDDESLAPEHFESLTTLATLVQSTIKEQNQS